MEQIEQVKVAVLEEQMKTLSKGLDSLGGKIDALRETIDTNYVKKEDFQPVKESVDSMKLWQAKVVGIALAVSTIMYYVIQLLNKK